MLNQPASWSLSRRTFLKATASTAALIALGNWSACAGDKAGPVLRIGLVTDSHYANRPPNGERFYAESVPKMEEAASLFNQEKVNLAVHIGDLKDEDPEPTEERTLQYLREQEQAFAQYTGPRYHVLGNHDLDSISKEQFLARAENTGIEAQQSYYSFDREGFHFVVLDANFRQDGVAYEKGNFEWTDTFIPRTQLFWLQDDLQAAQSPAIVFVHQLLDPEQTEEHRVKNASEVREVLEKSGYVLAVFQGHQHKGGYHLVNGIHYYTLLAMVEGSGPENNSYAILDIYANGDLVVNGYRRVTDLKMAYAKE